jgi:hypothetical protein
VSAPKPKISPPPLPLAAPEAWPLGRLGRLGWYRPPVSIAPGYTALIEARAHVVVAMAKASQVWQRIGPARVALFDVIDD